MGTAKRLVIDTNDLHLIQEIADKYNITLFELCNDILKNTNTQFNIKVSKTEYEIIEKLLYKVNLKRRNNGASELKIRYFCGMIITEAVKQNILEKTPIEDFFPYKGKRKVSDKKIIRNITINIAFNDYKAFTSFLEFLNITSLKKVQVIMFFIENAEQLNLINTI